MSESGFTVWLTGLPCAGKSTIAKLVARRILQRGRRVEVLDGDVIRQNLSYGLGFNREDRDRNIRRVAFVAKLLSRNDVAVVVAVVSPYRSTRDEARQLIKRFVEVFVDCPQAECERRDVKGMYKRARAGELKGFTGLDDPYESPQAAECILPTATQTPEESASRVERALLDRGYLKADDPDLSGSPDVERRFSELFSWA